MTSDSQLPTKVADRVTRWRNDNSPPQKAIDWPRHRWLSKIPEYSELIRNLPESLEREHVRRMAMHAADHEAGAAHAFIAAMAWGFGMSGYGPWRTRRMLDNTPQALQHLRQAATTVRGAGAIAGYRYLANEGRIAGLGPAFGTKFLYFIPQAVSGPHALIHDAVVTAAICSHGGPHLSPRAWSTLTYETFLGQLGSWSAVVGVEPTDLEMILFSSSVNPNSQRA